MRRRSGARSGIFRQAQGNGLQAAGQQDELQADTSDLILGETNENVVDLLKKCRHAMNDAVDLLEVYNTGGQTLAASQT